MRIAIVGAGVNGLSCGVRLLEQGHAVTIFAERRTPDTTSDRAAAVFSPFQVESSPRVRAWTRASFATFEELARATPESGVSMGVLREHHLAATPIPSWSEIVHGFHRATPPAGCRESFVAVVPRMDMLRYMPWLERRFERELGGTFVQARVLDLEEPFDEGFELVVNASGIGARRLAHDDAVFPMRGQVLHVSNALHLTDCVCREGSAPELAYSIPFDDHVVVGGTCEPDEWIEETDERSLAALLERTRDLLRRDGLADPDRFGRRRLRALAGLRPGRRVGDDDACVRLEREELGDGRAIVHDYGHAGAGVTLSWGCASDVARLCVAEKGELRARNAG